MWQKSAGSAADAAPGGQSHVPGHGKRGVRDGDRVPAAAAGKAEGGDALLPQRDADRRLQRRGADG